MSYLRTIIRKAAVIVGARRSINFIEGSNVTITVTDDSANDRVDVTIASAGGSGSPGGVDTNVQFNDAGSFGGDSLFTYNKTTDTLTLKLLQITGTGGAGLIGSQGSFSETLSGLALIIGNNVKADTSANQVIKTSNDNAYWIKLRYDKGISFHGPLAGAIGTTAADDANENGRWMPNGNLYMPNETASTILGLDSNKEITSLDTATYPSLTELAYVKGVTSDIQTQLNSKLDDTQFDGLAKITVGTTTPVGPAVGDLWVDTN